MQKELKDKLDKVVLLINDLMVDPDIDIEYHIPEIAVTDGTKDQKDPYIMVKYVVSEYTQPTRKITLGKTYLSYTAEKIADLVTFSIESFKSEIDSVEMG
jgi:hypothetical protein